MVVPPSSKRLTIRNQRPCSKCGTSTWHICYGIRYEKPEPSSDFYEKHLFWSCKRCDEPSEETKQIPEPTEQTMLLTRLLRLVEENNLDGSTLEVKGDNPSQDPVFWRKEPPALAMSRRFGRESTAFSTRFFQGCVRRYQVLVYAAFLIVSALWST